MNCTFSVLDEEVPGGDFNKERTPYVPRDKGLPDMICINTSHDFEIGTEMEVPTASEDEYMVEDSSDRSHCCSRSTTVASWLTRNVVGLNNEQMENDELSEPILNDADGASNIPSIQNESADNAISTNVIDIPLRMRRFERDTLDLRVHVLIMAMRRKMESFFIPPFP